MSYKNQNFGFQIPKITHEIETNGMGNTRRTLQWLVDNWGQIVQIPGNLMARLILMYWRTTVTNKITFTKKLTVNYIQGMLATNQFRTFCLPVSYLKTEPI
jgi:hypothetical protein